VSIFFLRHGESEANVKGLFAGQKEDSPLSDAGVEQAEAAAQELRGINFSRIVASKLYRTRQTAEIIVKAIGFDPSKIEYDDRVMEYDMGSLTGTPIRKVTSNELISAAGAENVEHFQARILSFLKEQKGSSEDILLVSHAAVGRMIECTKQGLDPHTFYDISPYPNAHAVELDLDWLR
jgi:broad specificity phosphatase PhoE